MKKVLIVLGILAVGVAGYFGYDKLYGTHEEKFVCGKNDELQVTFVASNYDGSILSCHACAQGKCDVGNAEQCSAARLNVGFMVAFGMCKQV